MNDYTDIINSSALVMVEFYATWCPHCRRMEPVVEQIRECWPEVSTYISSMLTRTTKSHRSWCDRHSYLHDLSRRAARMAVQRRARRKCTSAETPVIHRLIWIAVDILFSPIFSPNSVCRTRPGTVTDSSTQ